MTIVGAAPPCRRQGRSAVTSVGERWKNLWETVREEQAVLPSHVPIPPENVDAIPKPVTPFEAGEHYFQVIVNEMYLRNSREWASRYDPMVMAVTEFAYGGKIEVVPFVVGPELLGKGVKAPEGMLYTNTRVAGLHPFAGSRFVSTVMLYRVERKNYIKDVLRLVEQVSGVLDFATGLSAYVKLADVVLEGVETLVGLEETQAVLGARTEFGAGGASPLVPSYLALIDLPDVEPESLAVRKGKLYEGEEPFRRADYVLCSIEQLPKRDDEQSLPFFGPLWTRVVEDATSQSSDAWDSAKANMLALAQACLLSPDLTEPQKETLIAEYTDKMQKHRKIGQNILKLGPEQTSKLNGVRGRTQQILDLD